MHICLAIATQLLWAAAPAKATDIVLATELRSTNVTTYAGVAAWSSYVPGRGYVLRIYRDGMVTTPALHARRDPFDVDLGPDGRGRVTAVYSRCGRARPDEVVASGCRLYRYVLGGTEQRVRSVTRGAGFSEHEPTIWHSRIAFARYHDRGRNGPIVDSIFVADGKRVRELPRGTLRRGSEPANTAARVRTMDLRGRRLAYSWIFPVGFCRSLGARRGDLPFVTQLWLLDVVERTGRRLAEGCSDDDDTFDGASLYGQGLTYLQDLSHIERTIRLPGGELSSMPVDPDTHFLARDGSTRVTVRDFNASPDAATECQIVASVSR
jgi:hypothetical protein